MARAATGVLEPGHGGQRGKRTDAGRDYAAPRQCHFTPPVNRTCRTTKLSRRGRPLDLLLALTAIAAPVGCSAWFGPATPVVLPESCPAGHGAQFPPTPRPMR